MIVVTTPDKVNAGRWKLVPPESYYEPHYPYVSAN